MPTITAQVINHTLANVSVTMADALNISAGTLTIGGLTYNQVVSSLGSDVYECYKMYIYSENAAQTTQVLTYFIFDSNGDRKIQSLIPATDPYQYLTSLFYTPEKGLVVLNGNSGITLDVLPLTSVMFNFYNCRVSNQGNQHLINYADLEERVVPQPTSITKSIPKNTDFNSEINWLPLVLIGVGVIGYIYLENKK